VYATVTITPGSNDLALCVAPRDCASPGHMRTPYRVVVVFTKSSDAEAALRLANALATSPAVGILLVCPVTRSLAGRLRLERFLRFVRRCADSHSRLVDSLERLRIVIWPCGNRHDVVEDFASARSVVLLRRRRWRPWGRSYSRSAMMETGTVSLLIA
jgi:hypothetical protein